MAVISPTEYVWNMAERKLQKFTAPPTNNGSSLKPNSGSLRYNATRSHKSILFN